MSVSILSLWALYLLANEPRHELRDDGDLMKETMQYFYDAANHYNQDDPERLVYWARRESTLLLGQVGGLGEEGFCQAHGVARKTCEAAGYDITTRKGGAYCLALLMDMGRRRCGSRSGADRWYMSGSCHKAYEKAKSRNDAYLRRLAKFEKARSMNELGMDDDSSVIVEANKKMSNEAKALKIMSNHDGLQGYTSKLDIGSDSVYVHTAWAGDKLSYIDITLSRGDRGGENVLVGATTVADLSLQRFDLARCWVEESCKFAVMLLDKGGTVEDLIDHWKGVNGYPSGMCPQLQSIVVGPLHATAKLLESNINRWKLSIEDVN